MNWNPLLWVHMRLIGKRSIVLMPAIVGVGIVILSAMSFNSVQGEADAWQIANFWQWLCCGAQALFLFLMAPSAVRRAVSRDTESGMLISHRLTPMSNTKIVVGYMTGPAAQLFLLVLVCMFLGAVFNAIIVIQKQQQTALTVWAGIQSSMLCLSFMLMALMLLVSLVTGGKGNVITGLAVLAFFGGVFLLQLVPGLALLFGVLNLFSLLSLLGMTGGFTLTPLVGCVAQAAFGAIFFAACCRRIRQPEKSMFSLPLALLLSLMTGFTLVGGMLNPQLLQQLGNEFATPMQIVFSTATQALVTLFILSATATKAVTDDRRARYGEGRGSGAAWLGFPLLSAAITILTMVAMATMRSVDAFLELRSIALLGAAFLAAAIVDYAILYWAAAAGRKGVIALIIILALRIGPLIVDGLLSIVRLVFSDGPEEFAYVFSGLSPFGTFMMLRGESGLLLSGLIGQGALAAIALMLVRRTRARLTGAGLPQPVGV